MLDSTPNQEENLNTTDAVIREVEGHYIVNNPKTGALSALNEAEMIAFERLGEQDGLDRAADFFKQLGQEETQARDNAEKLERRLRTDGWSRSELPTGQKQPLASVYFTITRECNLACPYCYQGLRKRARKIMPLENAKTILDKIAAINSESHIIVTGGEPLMHPEFFEIMDMIRDHGFSASLLTNGAYINDERAARIAAYENIERVQVSLDGIKEETHALCRGKNSFQKTMDGIHALARHNAPLLLAPTIHDDNADEIVPIAKLAVSLGGSISANDLKSLPQDENDGALKLSPETYRRVKAELTNYLVDVCRNEEGMLEKVQRLSTRSCTSDPVNSTFICGVAYSLVDIDWNGDVYPCHLLKAKELIMGNAVDQDFDSLFNKAKEMGARTESHEISQCSSCSFMSTCGSGCRAGTYFTYGTFEKPSPSCSDHRWANTRRLLRSKGIDMQ